MGANLGGGWGECIPPNNSAAFPPIFSSPRQRTRLLLFFFDLHYIIGKKWVIWEVMTYFFVFTSLHFTVVGKNLDNRAGVSHLLNHPPNYEKWQKMVNFAESFPPPMLNIDLHPCITAGKFSKIFRGSMPPNPPRAFLVFQSA